MNSFEHALWKHKALISLLERLVALAFVAWVIFQGSRHHLGLQQVALVAIPMIGWDLVLQIWAPKYRHWWLLTHQSVYHPRSETGKKLQRISSIGFSAALLGMLLWAALQHHIR